MLTYTVWIDYKEFKFSDYERAMVFANLAKLTSADETYSVKIEILHNPKEPEDATHQFNDTEN